MLRKGVARRREPGFRRGLLRERRQLVEAQVEAGDRAGQVGRAVHEPSVQRVRALDVLLDHVIVELLRREVAASDETIRPRSIAYSPSCRSATSSWSSSSSGHGSVAARRTVSTAISSALERLHERRQLTMRRSAVEPAHADVDRMDLTAADDRHHLVSGLLQLEALGDELRMVARHRRCALVAEEIGRVEQEDVERGSRSTRRSREAAEAHGSARSR